MIGTSTVLTDQRIADYKARLRQEDSALLIPTAGPRTSSLHSTGHGHVIQPGANDIDDPPLVGEPASPGHATRSLPTSGLPMLGSSLTVVVILVRTPHTLVQSVPWYDETSDDDNYQLGFGALLNRNARHPLLPTWV